MSTQMEEALDSLSRVANVLRELADEADPSGEFQELRTRLSRIAMYAGWCGDNTHDATDENRFSHIVKMAQGRECES